MNIKKILIESGAVSINTKEPYKYSSGILSPIYTDNRILISEPRYYIKITNMFSRLIKKNNITFDKIAGTATAGIPWASFLAYKLKKPMIYIRSEIKEHGKKKLIEGELKKNEEVLVIEDLISTGGSAINTIKIIRGEGGTVDTCFALFTYNMVESKNMFKEENVNLITLTNIGNMLSYMIKENIIKKEDKKIVLDWKENPGIWADKYGFK